MNAYRFGTPNNIYEMDFSWTVWQSFTCTVLTLAFHHFKRQWHKERENHPRMYQKAVRDKKCIKHSPFNFTSYKIFQVLRKNEEAFWVKISELWKELHNDNFYGFRLLEGILSAFREKQFMGPASMSLLTF